MTINVYSQEKIVNFLDEPEWTFNKRLDEAFEKARDTIAEEKGFWIGFTIDRFQDESSSYYSGGRETIEKLIYLRYYDIKEDEKTAIKSAAERALRNLENETDRKILRRKNRDFYEERAILLLYQNLDRYNPEKVKILNIRQPFARHHYPIFWLGKANDDESLAFLDNIYKYSKDRSIRNNIVNAIGIHESKDLVFPIIRNIIEKEKEEKVLKSAIFWVGNIHIKEAAHFLEKLFYSFKSDELKESIVFALYINDSKDGDGILIEIAKSRNERVKVRKNALFWLSQRATKKSLETLKEIAVDSDEMKLQEHAVFAISQFPDMESIPTLIKIAKSNPHKNVRKKAIFWLSQKDDPRVIRFLEDILLDR